MLERVTDRTLLAAQARIPAVVDHLDTAVQQMVLGPVVSQTPARTCRRTARRGERRAPNGHDAAHEDNDPCRARTRNQAEQDAAPHRPRPHQSPLCSPAQTATPPAAAGSHSMHGPC